MNKIDDGMIKDGEDQLKKIDSMISSMTLEEKQKPEVLAAQPSRRQRIAQGSGYEAVSYTHLTLPTIDRV